MNPDPPTADPAADAADAPAPDSVEKTTATTEAQNKLAPANPEASKEYMALGYLVIWAVIFLFVALLLKRTQRMQRRLDRLDDQLQRVERNEP